MNSKPTYEQVADDFELWVEYVDPDNTMTQEQFDALSTEQRVEIQVECFGDESE